MSWFCFGWSVNRPKFGSVALNVANLLIFSKAAVDVFAVVYSMYKLEGVARGDGPASKKLRKRAAVSTNAGRPLYAAQTRASKDTLRLKDTLV